MIDIRVATIATTVLLGTGWMLSTGGQEMPPKIRLYVDLGRIEETDSVLHTFELHNPGQDDWTIEKIHLACGCLKVESSPRIIQANTSKKLVLRFSPRGYHGRLNQAAYVTVRGKEVKVFECVVGANIAGLRARPGTVHFGTLIADELQTRDVQIVAAGVTAGKLTKIEVKDPRLKDELVDGKSDETDLLPIDKETRGRLVRIIWSSATKATAAKGDAIADDVNDMVVVHTDTGYPPIMIPVQGAVQGRHGSFPGAVFFGSILSGQPSKRTVRLSASLKDLDVGNVTIKSGHPDRIAGRLRATKTGPPIMELDFNADTPVRPKLVAGDIQIINAQGVRLVSLPYAAYVLAEN